MSVTHALFGCMSVNGRWRRFGISTAGVPTDQRHMRYPCSAQAVLTHPACDTLFAAGFARLPQVKEDTQCTGDPLAGGERLPDQPQQASILDSAVWQRVLQPRVEAARRHV